MPLVLVGAVRGLVSEGLEVRRLLARTGPDIIALSLSPEGLDAITSIISGGREMEEKMLEPVNPEEEIYMDGLGEFGQVVKPPPCFTEAVDYGLEHHLRLVALDMDDEHYSAAYCANVSSLDIIRQGRIVRQAARRGIEAPDPRNFVLEWDRTVNRLHGYRKLEQARERWMARKLHGLASGDGNGRRIVAVMELERLSGVEMQLADMGLEFDAVHGPGETGKS